MKNINQAFPGKNMQEKTMRSFIVLAETRSYHLAAEKLCMTQSTLTKQIQSIEMELGLNLFTRSNKGTSLSVHGRHIYNEIKRIVEAIDALRYTASSLTQTKTLNIGFGMATNDIVPECAGKFISRHPDTYLKLIDLDSATQNKKLLSGTLDVGFMRQDLNSTLQQFVIKKDRLVIIHNENSTSHSSTRSLEKKPFISINPEVCPGTGDIVERYRRKYFSEKFIIPASSYANIHSLVKANIGIAIIPKSSISEKDRDFGIIEIDDPLATWNIVLAWDIHTHHELRDRFIEYAQKALRI